jgi:hypothetical protein
MKEFIVFSQVFLSRFLEIGQSMVEADRGEEDLEFKWGIKKGVGGKKKDFQFYQSFTYDGVEYELYDCVYLWVDGEPEPHIGKLLKIMENPDKKKIVKVLWFFRPCEVLKYPGVVVDAAEDELFLASGEGAGLANLNPLVIELWKDLSIYIPFSCISALYCL